MFISARYHLLRFDMGKEYTISSTNRSDCHVSPLNTTMPTVFAWVAQARCDDYLAIMREEKKRTER
jgi:hypothetical protein